MPLTNLCYIREPEGRDGPPHIDARDELDRFLRSIQQAGAGKERAMGARMSLIWAVLLGLAGVAFGQVLETPHGQAEFIGLKSWNARQLYEKLVAIDPRNPLCMVGLEKLGAAASSVNKELQGGRIFMLAIVIEPQFSGRIKRRPVPTEEVSTPARWSDVLESLTQNFDDYMTALQLYDYYLDGKTDTALREFEKFVNPEAMKKIWTSLGKLNENKDKELAAWIVMNDKDVKHRIAAASVLANFRQFDSTWWMLMDALRYDDMASAAADGLLRALSRAFSREIDWSPAIASIRALLDGTNPAHFLTTVRVLTQTRISVNIAVPLLSNGGSLLVDFLAASRDQERAPVRQLLVRLAGKDLGSDPAAWARWIASLSKNKAY